MLHPAGKSCLSCVSLFTCGALSGSEEDDTTLYGGCDAVNDAVDGLLHMQQTPRQGE
jgi:hypothetical protein